MATQETSDPTDKSKPAERTGADGVSSPIGAEAKTKRSSTRPVSFRVSEDELALIDEAAKRRDMKRSDLASLATLQFIGEARANARKVHVSVPDDVRHEVRSAQETMDQLTVAMNRVGKNLLAQLKNHWAGEPAALEEIESASTELIRMQSHLDRVAGDLRQVLDRPQW